MCSKVFFGIPALIHSMKISFVILADHFVNIAFILYRQHQQAAVVAQYPGLPNPEISKIIGEQWQSLGADSKNEWKALAEVHKDIMEQQKDNELT
jgi:hypothetical protein